MIRSTTEEVKTMPDSSSDIQLNRSLIVGGGVLVAVGGLLGFAGMALLSSALISATRQWSSPGEASQPDGSRALGADQGRCHRRRHRLAQRPPEQQLGPAAAPPARIPT